jgi:hypothetical protein
VEQDKVVSVPVDDYEQKVYKERVREELIISDNGVNWMLERNDRLAKLGKKNRIRILDFYPEKAGEDVDAIDGDKDGVKATVMNAGDANHG